MGEETATVQPAAEPAQEKKPVALSRIVHLALGIDASGDLYAGAAPSEEAAIDQMSDDAVVDNDSLQIYVVQLEVPVRKQITRFKGKIVLE